MEKLTLRLGIILILVSVSNGCAIEDRIKNNSSRSQFILTVYANDTCEFEINGTKLTSLKRHNSIGTTSQKERIVMNICSTEGSDFNHIYVKSMYPGNVNPPLAFANSKSIAANYERTKFLYFVDTRSFPITDRWKAYYATIDQNAEIDVFGEVQLSILNPDWESLNYSPALSVGLGSASNPYKLKAVQGNATFYGVSDIKKYNILYKLVGTAMRSD